MKEAAGEANMTVVTIILIAAIVAIVTPIVTSMMKSSAKKTCCMSYGGSYKSNKCYSTAANGTETVINDGVYYDSQKNACK